MKWFVATPSDMPTTIASAVLWERVENANATPYEPETTVPWGGPAQVEVANEIMVHYRATVGERPHYGERFPVFNFPGTGMLMSNSMQSCR